MIRIGNFDMDEFRQLGLPVPVPMLMSRIRPDRPVGVISQTRKEFWLWMLQGSLQNLEVDYGRRVARLGGLFKPSAGYF